MVERKLQTHHLQSSARRRAVGLLASLVLVALATAGCTQIHTEAKNGTVSVAATVPTIWEPDATKLITEAEKALHEAAEKHCKPGTKKEEKIIGTVSTVLGLVKTALGLLPVHSHTRTINCVPRSIDSR